jgi:hypothetical protein
VGRDHPETSEDAAHTITPSVGNHHEQILDLLQEVYPNGLTCREISDKTGRPPNQEATRLLELRETVPPWVEYVMAEPGQLVDKEGRLRRPTTPGNTGLVQRITPQGSFWWPKMTETLVLGSTQMVQRPRGRLIRRRVSHAES